MEPSVETRFVWVQITGVAYTAHTHKHSLQNPGRSYTRRQLLLRISSVNSQRTKIHCQHWMVIGLMILLRLKKTNKQNPKSWHLNFISQDSYHQMVGLLGRHGQRKFYEEAQNCKAELRCGLLLGDLKRCYEQERINTDWSNHCQDLSKSLLGWGHRPTHWQWGMKESGRLRCGRQRDQKQVGW